MKIKIVKKTIRKPKKEKGFEIITREQWDAIPEDEKFKDWRK